MPRVPYVTEADWLNVYEIRIRDHTHPQDGQTFGYGRVWAGRCENPLDDNLTRFDERVANLTQLFPIQAADRILIQGCGLGFLIESFKAAGFSECFGLDNSDHVSFLRPTQASADTVLVERSIDGGQPMRSQLQIATGGQTFAWVITESVMESYEDAELSALIDETETVLAGGLDESQIIHMVMPVQDPANPDRSIGPIFNQKTLAEWKAIRPGHSWVDYVRWEVG